MDGPSILLIGMRGAGKTTLGQLVASHLGLPFEDADSTFCTANSPHIPPTYVKQHGWPAFRAEETRLLRLILADLNAGHRRVVSLGGGIVEEEVNRELLKEFWGGDHADPVVSTQRGIVIHVFREIDQVFEEPDKAGGRQAPKWKEGGQEAVWARRRPWFRECSSHEFINFTNSEDALALEAMDSSIDLESRATAHRMQFEHVERDFIRFFRRILSPYSPSTSTTTRPFSTPSPISRSYLVTLPFPSLSPLVPFLHTLCTGASAIELRADLLSDPHPHPRPGIAEAYENPSLSYISEQHGLLRRWAPELPIVFTLRTPDQGGRYGLVKGEGGKKGEEALFATLQHALKLGTDLIDIEMGLDPIRTTKVVEDAKRRGTTVIISWRDTTPPSQGGFSWSSSTAKDRYQTAVSLGADIVKIVGTASSVEDNFLLRVFAFSDLVKTGPPLSAYNMGLHGRMSRFLNPLLASVTHPLAREGTERGIVGAPSMTFKEVQMALHLSGLLSRRRFVPFRTTASAAENGQLAALMDVAVRGFEELGLPFELLKASEVAGSFRSTLEFQLGEPFFAGGFVDGQEAGVEALSCMDLVGEVAKDVGGIDTFIVRRDEDGKTSVHGEHIYTQAMLSLLEARLSPSNAISPTSFALVLSPVLPASQQTPCSQVPSTPASTARTNDSLKIRSVLSALGRLGIRNVKVVDPRALTPREKEEVNRKPTIIIDFGGGDVFGEAEVERLLESATGAHVMGYILQASSSPFHRPQIPAAPSSDSLTTGLIDDEGGSLSPPRK